ncbi:MAG: hypothetical protein O2970_11445 [Proteobacteria bacterium]|nr:hypothetical protein [Pseudomonadota bacterium]
MKPVNDIKKQKEWLYENGIETEGEVVLGSNSFFVYVFDIICSFIMIPHFQRRIKYKFLDKKGNEHIGKDSIVLFLEPSLFFAKNGRKLIILYSPNAPTVNKVFQEKEKNKIKKEN